MGVPLDEELHEVPIGKGSVLMDGEDVTIFALGKSCSAVVEAAEVLAEYGISCGVVDPVYAKPLDTELIFETARKTRQIVTVEENVLAGGFGSAVLETLKDGGLDDVMVHRVGMPDAFIEHGTAADQRRQLQLDAEGIVDQILGTYFPDVAARVRGGSADQDLAATA